MPTNNGVVSRFPNLQSAKPIPGSAEPSKNGSAATVRAGSAASSTVTCMRRAEAEARALERRFRTEALADRVVFWLAIALMVAAVLIVAGVLMPRSGP